MSGETVRLLVPFEALLSSIIELSLEDKVALRDALDEQIEAAGEESSEAEADAREARDAYERGDYVTVDDYIDRRRRKT